MSAKAFIDWLFTSPEPILICCGYKLYTHSSIFLHRIEFHDTAKN